MRIYSNEKLVASHRLCSASSGWQTVPEHHAPLWQQVSQVEHRPLSAWGSPAESPENGASELSR
ncbi:hypothetical protein SS323385_0015 [Shigella sonnei 3233-85]|nr:hypothetical protein SS323385_0015 [Shigella sonnei 3233-85]